MSSPPAPPSLIIRITAKSGRSRIQVPATALLSELKSQVALQFKVPVQEVALSRDEKGKSCLIGDSKSIVKLGLNNGDQLFVHSRTETQMSNAELPVKSVPFKTETAASDRLSHQRAESSRSQRSEATAGTSAASEKKEEGEANFVPFEYYLNERQFDIVDLPLCRSFKPVPLVAGAQTKLPAAATLKHQAYRHVDQLEVMNVKELNDFVRYWKGDLDMLQQRAGFLIGYFLNDKHYKGCGIRAVVEAVYEPAQVSTSDWVTVVPEDPFMPSVVAISSAFGLEVVGWIVTHLPRERLVSATEAIRIAKMQWQFCHPGVHYTGYPVSTFVTMMISPDAERGGEVVPNAFMVSDMGMALLRDGIIDEASTGDDSMIKVAKACKTELFPQVLESAQPINEFDVDWLLVRVNETMPVKSRCVFARSEFPKMNRHTSVQPTDVGTFLLTSKAPASKPWEKYSDFHFLLYVAEVLGLESALSICDAIKAERDIDPDFATLLTSL